MQQNPTSSWLKQFFSREDVEYIQGDNLATTLQLCGAVALAAVLEGSTSPDRLSAVTGLPVAFCAVSIANLDYNHIWVTDNFKGLCKALRDDLDDYKEIDESLSVMLEDYWVRSKLPGIDKILPALRGHSLLFGRQQDWIGNECLEEDLLRSPAQTTSLKQ
jgi:hypothetical protein